MPYIIFKRADIKPYNKLRFRPYAQRNLIGYVWGSDTTKNINVYTFTEFISLREKILIAFRQRKQIEKAIIPFNYAAPGLIISRCFSAENPASFKDKYHQKLLILHKHISSFYFLLSHTPSTRSMRSYQTFDIGISKSVEG